MKHSHNRDYQMTEDCLYFLDYRKEELLDDEKFENIRESDGHPQIQIKWKVFDATESDWMLNKSFWEDLPVLFNEYLVAFCESTRKKQCATSKRFFDN